MSIMAMQLRTVTNKLLKSTLNLVRYNHSRATIPLIFWEDPLRRHRKFLSEFWNIPDPFDAISPIQRYMGHRMLSFNSW